jgi:uncharacterized protein YdhG (YjbR/CyaY superfamily)
MPSSTTAGADAKAQVRAYLAALPPGARRSLMSIREAIRSAAPSATEHFSYRMPGFRLDGKMFLWYAAWKNHLALYPITAAIRRAHAPALARYEVSKGTVRFPMDEPPPLALVKKLARARVAEIRGGKGGR